MSTVPMQEGGERIIDIAIDSTAPITKVQRQLEKKHKNFQWKLSAKEKVDRVNERHYEYYSTQLPDLDWPSFNATMTSKLPVTFRFCTLRGEKKVTG